MTSIVVSTLTVSLAALSASLPERIESAYIAQNSVGQIECKAPGLRHISSRYIQGKSITTNMLVEDYGFTVKVDRNLNISLSSQELNTTAIMDRWNNLTFDFENISRREKSIVTRYKLNQMKCAVVINQDKPVILYSQKVHINVHPHQGYDRSGYTTEATNRYYADKTYQSVALVDKRRNSLDVSTFIDETGVNVKRGYYSTPMVSIPQDVPIIVSPAGHNLFDIKNDNLDVTYTGGNLNYCISNNTTNLVESFLQTSAGGRLNITHDMDAIVAQNRNVFSGKFSSANFGVPFFGQQLGFIPRDIFRDDYDFSEKYHLVHSENITSYIYEMTNFYQTLTYSYRYNGKQIIQKIKGSGRGKYSIYIEYINN